MINNVTLTGRLTADPDLRYTQSGKEITTFTLAVNRPKNANGEQNADFIRCQAWEKRAVAMADHLRKGSLIGITGNIRTGSYTNNENQKVYTTDVVVNEFTFLESKGREDQQASRSNSYQTEPTAPPAGGWGPAPTDGTTLDISDDDMPF